MSQGIQEHIDCMGQNENIQPWWKLSFKYSFQIMTSNLFNRPGDSFGFQVEQIILVFSEDVSKHSTIAVKALGFQL